MSLTHPDRLEVHHDDAEQTAPEAVTKQSSAKQQPNTIRPSFTITDAATACAVSRKTITRKLPELAGYGAAKDEDGVWRIPVEALLAVGLRPGRSLPDATATPARQAPARQATSPASSSPAVTQDTITIARDRWDDLRIRLARAEAEASERALALADARLALRALTAGPAKTAPVQSNTPTGHALPAAPTAATPTAAAPAGPSTTALTAEGVGDPGSAAPPASNSQPVPPAAPGQSGAVHDVVAARVRAAQTGGHVPAGSISGKKRRWWQSSR